MDDQALQGLRHIIDCKSNLGAMKYDGRCTRCTKINKVINLRRKTTANGASQTESVSSHVIAQKLIDQFKLTRGEVYDRAYDHDLLISRARPGKMSSHHRNKTPVDTDDLI